MDRIIIDFHHGARAGQTEIYPLVRFASLYMGRDPNCDIRLDAELDLVVSRSHAVIEWIDEDEQPRRYTLTDLLSSNGTFLNGERIEGTVPLHSGDRVRLGVDGPEFSVLIEQVPEAVSATVTKSMPAVVDPTQPLQSRGQATVRRPLPKPTGG